MKNWKILTIVGLTLVAAALLVSTVSAMGPFGGFGGGMMGRGYGYGYGYPAQPGLTTPTTPNGQYYQPVYPFQFGGGCHGGFGQTLYGSSTAPYTYTGTPLNITTAKA